MPFLYNIIVKKQMTTYKKIKKIPPSKRVSCIASHLNGSLTLEAILTLPLFISAMIAIIFFVQSTVVQMRIQKALFNQTMKISGYAFYIDEVGLGNGGAQIVETAYIKQAVISEVGKGYLDNTYIVGGSDGINVNYIKEYEDGILDVELVYKMRVPFNLFGIKPVSFTTKLICHTWVGEESQSNSEETEYAYITPNGVVYHIYSDCTYLVMTLETGTVSLLESDYDPCNICCEDAAVYKNVYYTKYGERYHSTMLCSNLHRNVFMVEMEKAVYEYELCTRCEKRKIYDS